MAERRHLPPQIRRIEFGRRAGSKPEVRYQLTVDTGVVDGKRKQLRRRYRTEKEARAALAEIQGQVNAGSYVQPSVSRSSRPVRTGSDRAIRSDRRQRRATNTSSSRCAASWASWLSKI